MPKDKKPEVDTRGSKFNMKEPESVNFKSMGVNANIVVSNVLGQIGQAAGFLPLQHAAQLANTFFTTIEVCG